MSCVVFDIHQGVDAVIFRGPFPHRQWNPRPHWPPDQRTHVSTVIFQKGASTGSFFKTLISTRAIFCVCGTVFQTYFNSHLLVIRETNSMVEEFMLLANISVAQKIYDEFPDCAMLRKHPAPPPSNYDILLKAAKSKVSGDRWSFHWFSSHMLVSWANWVQLPCYELRIVSINWWHHLKCVLKYILRWCQTPESSPLSMICSVIQSAIPTNKIPV